MCNFSKLVNESTAQLERLIATRYNKWMLCLYKQTTSETAWATVSCLCSYSTLGVSDTRKHQRKITEGFLPPIYLSEIHLMSNACRNRLFRMRSHSRKSDELTQPALSGGAQSAQFVTGVESTSLWPPPCFEHNPSNCCRIGHFEV